MNATVVQSLRANIAQRVENRVIGEVAQGVIGTAKGQAWCEAGKFVVIAFRPFSRKEFVSARDAISSLRALQS